MAIDKTVEAQADEVIYGDALKTCGPAALLMVRDRITAEIERRIKDIDAARTMLGGMKRRVRSDKGAKRDKPDAK